MKAVLLGPKRVKLSETNDYKSNWQHVPPQGKDQRAVTLQEKEKKYSHKLRTTKVIGIIFNLK